MMAKKKVILSLSIALLAAALLCGAAFVSVWNGWILLNSPSKEAYPVRGVDVSAYQGKIDWQVLSQQGNISFAFIKATEGSTYIDPCFAYNYAQAQKTDLRIGAYHFFSFDSPGKTQGKNFISTVAKTENMLPPVVDLEFYGDKAKNPPSAESVHAELNDLLYMLEQHYGRKPILYVTEESYSHYIQGYYAGYDIWYRNVISPKGLPDGRPWTFWQYTNRETLDGYTGEETFIDMNVFFGTQGEFKQY